MFILYRYLLSCIYAIIMYCTSLSSQQPDLGDCNPREYSANNMEHIKCNSTLFANLSDTRARLWRTIRNFQVPHLAPRRSLFHGNTVETWLM